MKRSNFLSWEPTKGNVKTYFSFYRKICLEIFLSGQIIHSRYNTIQHGYTQDRENSKNGEGNSKQRKEQGACWVDARRKPGHIFRLLFVQYSSVLVFTISYIPPFLPPPPFALLPVTPLISIFFSSISYIFSLLFPQKPSLLSFLHEAHAHHSFKFISSLPPFCPLGHCLDQALMLSASATHMILPASPPCFPSTLHPVIRHISSHCLPIKTLILLGSDRNSSHLAPVYLLPSPCHSSIHFIGLVPFWTLQLGWVGK